MATQTAIDRPAERRTSIRKLFEQQRPELSMLLPRGMSIDRLYRLALTECTKNPKLLECSAESWALAMQTCAAQGLYPDSGIGMMYLIPRNNSKKKADGSWVKVMEVSAQRGYQGDIQLARNSGEISDIYAQEVYAKDHYVVRLGLDRTIEHTPYEPKDENDDRGPLRAVYGVAKLKSGEVAMVVLWKADVMRHKKSAQGTDDAKSPWVQHEAAMWRKTAIHDLSRWLPKATESMELLGRGDEPEQRSKIDISATTLPVTAEKPALEAVKDQLRAEAGHGTDESSAEGPAGEQVEACDHPEIPPSRLANTPSTKTLTCLKCGEEFRGEQQEPTPAVTREPGDDTDDGPPVDEVKAFAGKAAAQTGKPRQGRLAE